MKIYQDILVARQTGQKLLAILVDPEKIAIGTEYIEAGEFIDGVSYVESPDFTGYINKNGDVVYKDN